MLSYTFFANLKDQMKNITLKKNINLLINTLYFSSKRKELLGMIICLLIYSVNKKLYTVNTLKFPSIGSANPANPITNLSGDVLDYFGAFTVSRDTIVIKT